MYAAPIAQAGGAASGGAVLVASNTTDISHTLLHLRRGAVAERPRRGAAGGAGGRAADPARAAPAGAAGRGRGGDRADRRSQRGGCPRPARPTRSASSPGCSTGCWRRSRRSRATERRFLADASHELRTPVTALLGNVDYAARHGADPEVLADLQRDAERLARLVDDLLVLERSGAARQESEPVELDAVVREVAARHPDGRVPSARWSPRRSTGRRDALARSIENLIENGLVHGPDGGRVTVALGRRETVAVLTVSDEGPGTRSGGPRAAVRALLARPRILRAAGLRAGTVDRLRDRRAPPRDDLGRRLDVHRRTSALSANSHSALTDD